jgi:hypothetical protein
MICLKPSSIRANKHRSLSSFCYRLNRLNSSQPAITRRLGVALSAIVLLVSLLIISPASMAQPSRTVSSSLNQHRVLAPAPNQSSDDERYIGANNNEPNSFWSSAGSQPVSDEPISQLSGRRPFVLKGRSMAAARVSAAAPYNATGNGHKANRFSPASSEPSKFWIGTYYASASENANYLEHGEIPELRLDYETEDIICWRGQWEWGGKADKDGKLHVQFAVSFRDKVRVPQARRILGGRFGIFTGWLEPARSTAVWEYVNKEETRVAEIRPYGALTDDSGHRSDLDVIYERIAAGAPIYSIMSEYPRQFMRNHAAIAKMCAMYDTPRPFGPCHVEIWWGVTGSGKSHKAFHEYPEAYRKSIPGKWFEGYKGEKVVVFEEFNPEEDRELRLPELLKILDKYPYQVEIKGASCQLKANKFIFTTNIDPRKWYAGHAQQPALARRIALVKVFRLTRDQQEVAGVDGIIDYPGMTMPSVPLSL